MNKRLITLAFLALPLLVLGCSGILHVRHAPTALPLSDPRIRIAGLVTNRVVASRGPLWITLWITNVTDRELYVPTQFNCNNYTFATASTVCAYHGDSWGAVFNDFVLLKPTEAMEFSYRFWIIGNVGEGELSVDFYNNMRSDVTRQLEGTGVPFVVGLRQELGIITVTAPKKASVGNGSKPPPPQIQRKPSTTGSRR